MLNTFSDWLFNLMLWGAIISLLALGYQAFVGPIITGLTALIGLVAVVVLSLFWPRY